MTKRSYVEAVLAGLSDVQVATIDDPPRASSERAGTSGGENICFFLTKKEKNKIIIKATQEPNEVHGNGLFI